MSVQDSGEKTLQWRGHSIPVQSKYAKIQVNRILKGQTSESAIIFEFVKTIRMSIGFADVRVGQFGMFFLKRNTKNGLTVTDYYYPYVVATAAVPKTASGDFERVIAEVTNVLAQPQATLTEKIKAIDILDQIDTPIVLESLLLNANSENISIKIRSVTALLRRNNISKLDVAEKILLAPPTSIDSYLIGNLARALEGIKDPNAIPTLGRLLESHNIALRYSSAYAIRHTGVDAAIKPLTKALYDNDQNVRYQAVMGLAEITRQYSWGPALDQYNSNEQHYLNYWRNWAAKR
ncbi:MAG TPA: HEAT repeat domain-containing protein [Blastocatellia bacterium]|nr:HEAT repeat domain-containing protein [Blastocatellia bacterium]